VIANRAKELIAAGLLPRTARIAEHNPPLDAEDVFRAGEEGEAEAAAIIERAGRYLGIGLASIINMLNPQAIVLGGGLMNMGEKIMGPAVDAARHRSFAQAFGDVQIVEGELGERAAALGAIVVAIKKVGAGLL
jgi:glucokinase